MATDVIVPTLGESITEATLGQWIKKPGEPVQADEPIASLETDKVAVEVPSPVAGTMGDYLVKEGDTVAVGALIARIVDGAAAPAPQNGPAASSEAPTDTSQFAHIVNPGGPGENPSLHDDEIAPMPGQGHDSSSDMGLTLSPAVRRVVLEHGLDPSKIRGTGKDGRLTKDDVLAAAKAEKAQPAPVPAAPSTAAQAPAPAPAAAPAATGERREERVRMTRLRQTIAARLKEAQNTAALLTTFNDVDMTEVIGARNKYKDLFEKKHGIRLGFMGFFVKAAALAARDIPAVNASIEGDEIVYHDYLDVSVAVSAPNGLVVPVIRNADKMSFAEIEKTIADFGKRAKDGTLKMEEMRGGTFTISNGGVFGSLLSTPIINPPQSAVLGMHRIEERPVVKNGQIVARPMMYLALSYDHRLVDGREAVTFLVRMKEAIEDPTRLLIDL
ncbi:MAG: Dihydrolipoamide succinyltransferase component (E2) of 2-oxoglutarate dehydrogenase complex [uncultured Sphingosinicella sp.]|uniref:Dihydrolipoyllysine-residue succinyltransferase component of 2-oxoglutarate dehydrogenase complex n=1 Tax=uncultured Sphingosinicella sp. TaxID=478748 RepID=A0A6J4UCF9_9SPHN|nr:2-oxoglutarate dehydrogenase complex dihydrolipoyllysine-residue succinyltransferase [uncultured Sphingosinicella sp.]CAA9546162.1 MAG: Dihydrolipoamide succinyltransferase component (E2) of 2-oxoglutarate dehydrogenase complex [uncultured Sphingosinicella sp.]